MTKFGGSVRASLLETSILATDLRLPQLCSELTVGFPALGLHRSTSLLNQLTPNTHASHQGTFKITQGAFCTNPKTPILTVECGLQSQFGKKIVNIISGLKDTGMMKLAIKSHFYARKVERMLTILWSIVLRLFHEEFKKFTTSPSGWTILPQAFLIGRVFLLFFHTVSKSSKFLTKWGGAIIMKAAA